MTASNQLSESKRKLLERYLRSRESSTTESKRRIPRRPPEETIPLSFAQQQVWVHSQLAGDTSVYNEAITVFQHGRLDLNILERCFVEILRRHEIWRTTFDTIEGTPVQVVHSPPDHFSLKTIDLEHLEKNARESEAARLAAEDARKHFDLGRGPLLRCTLVGMGDEEHRLYITLHQIVFDAVTAYCLFLPELVGLYEAYSAGRSSPLTEPLLQYGDFAYWQRNSLRDDTFAEQLSYWRRKLADDVPVLAWPNDRTRPAYQSHRGAVQRFQFDTSVIAPLRDLCQREGVSSYMILLAALAAVLSQYTGQRELVLGGLSAGRKEPELESVFGYFVNPFPLRVDLSGHPTFQELIARVRETVLDALGNDSVPFEQIVESIRPDPDTSRNPIFQVILSQQPRMPIVAPGWNLATEEVSNGGSKLDLVIVLDERADALGGPITYNPDLFEASTIERMVEHWQTFLAAALADPGRRVDELPLMPDSERDRLLLEWNNTEVGYPAGLCLHQMVEEQAKRSPTAVAVRFDDTEMSYAELEERAGQLAFCLKGLGVRTGVAVAICVERSLEMVVAVLAVLKAGGMCVPLDPAYPKDRLAFIVAETETRVLLTQKKLAEDLSICNGTVICIDEKSTALSAENPPSLADCVLPHDVAFIIYTSGSTGEPKGVQVTHGNLVNSTLARKTYYQEPPSRFLLLSSLTFDSSLAGIFWTLGTGGTLILPPDQSRWALSTLIRLIVQHRVSVLLCVPSLYQELLNEAEANQLRSLRKVIVAGEECSRDLVDRHFRLVRNSELYNEYGPTEGSVWSSVYRCKPDSRLARVPIGKPIPNTRLYILNSDLQPVPVGISGELYIAGAGVASGYVKQPELNMQVFVSDPFRQDSGARLYKTGDLARYLPDGNIEFLGRIDDQVKIRGHRIELGEVEAAVRNSEGIRQAVALVREDVPSDKRLVCYIVPFDRAAFSLGGLRTFLRTKLPEYMIPSRYVLLDSLPLTSNGKINRPALPAPAGQYSPESAGFTAPRNSIEEKLAELWILLLGLPRVGIHDDFFDLGAHSLLAARLLAQIDRTFGKRLTMASLFAKPTIAALAAELESDCKQNSQESSSLIVAIKSDGLRPPLICIHGIAGHVLKYYRLAQCLDPKQPVYGLKSPNFGSDMFRDSVEDIAETYVRELRRFQSHGPYYLAGFSFGGLVAYEMANRLVAENEQIGMLALFDTGNLAAIQKQVQGSATHRWFGRITDKWKRSWNDPKSSRCTNWRRAVMAATDLGEAFAWRGWKSTYKFCRRHGYPTPAFLQDIMKIYLLAGQSYRPQPFPGRITLFRAETRDQVFEGDAKLGWGALALGGLDIHEIPCEHLSILETPSVLVLGDRLQLCLSTAQAEGM